MTTEPLYLLKESTLKELLSKQRDLCDTEKYSEANMPEVDLPEPLKIKLPVEEWKKQTEATKRIDYLEKKSGWRGFITGIEYLESELLKQIK